jgi:hypothetical protein
MAHGNDYLPLGSFAGAAKDRNGSETSRTPLR